MSHLEAGMSVANERTVVLLAATFGLDPYELVAGTDYPEAKSDRLPLVAARHTEVDLQLALFAHDLRWLETVGPLLAWPAAARLRIDTLAAWVQRLHELSTRVADRAEQARLAEATAVLVRQRSEADQQGPPDG